MTNESNRNKNQNRWQELAEQLGVADSPPVQSAGKANETPSAPEPRTAPPVEETPPRRHLEDPDPGAFVSVVEESVSVEFTRVPQTESEADLDELMSDQGETESESADLEAPASGQEEAGPSGRTSGRRRRRRRSSKKKKDPAGQAEGAAPGPEGETSDSGATAAVAETPAMVEAASGSTAGRPADQEAPRERGRSRGRNGQRRREREREPVDEPNLDEEEVHESGGPVGIDEDGEEEEVANYSNWTVPSWKDLIASLYRPDR